MALIGEMEYLTIGGNTYEIADATSRSKELTATYTAATYNLALNLSAAEDADDEEFQR